MTILHDHQAFTIQEYGGISRYFYELSNELRLLPDVVVANSTLFSNNEYLRKDGNGRPNSFFRCARFQKKIELMNQLNQWKSLNVFTKSTFDVFHPTYYDPYYVDRRIDKPIVLTFHDIIHEKFMKHDKKTLANKKRAMQRADKIIAVSESTKCDIGNYYHISEKKIVVIPLASSFASAGTRIGGEPPERYLLFVGGRQLYKNFSFFIAAIAPLLATDQRLFLYCVGGGSFTREERTLLHSMAIQSKVKYQAGTDENLKKFYSGALAFIFPSLYEGFGMPLLEAMSCGCPIGSSQTSSFPEVAGNASLYFDPTDRDSILDVVETLVSNTAVRMRLSKRGLERAKSFSWHSTALQTEQVYRSLI